MTGTKAASALRMGRDALRALQSISEAMTADDQGIRDVSVAKFRAIVMSQAPALRDVSADILDSMAGACSERSKAEIWIAGKEVPG